MAIIDPYLGVPIVGGAFDPVPIKAKFDAIFQGIQAFDGSQITAGTVQAAAMATAVNPVTRTNETAVDHVSSGLVWSIISGLNGTMTSGVVYIQGIRVPVSAVGSKAFSASQDTYIDVDYNGNITYITNTTNAVSPALTANSIRIGICVAGAASITSFNQGTTSTPVVSSNPLLGADSLGNIIYPRGPSSTRKMQNATKFSVYRSAAWTSGAPAIVPYDTKIYDTGVNIDVVTNKGRFTAPVAGYYQFSASAGISSSAAGQGVQISFYKNGLPALYGTSFTTSTGTWTDIVNVSGSLPLIAGDYVEVGLYGSSLAGAAGSTLTWFNGFLTTVS